MPPQLEACASRQLGSRPQTGPSCAAVCSVGRAVQLLVAERRATSTAADRSALVDHHQQVELGAARKRRLRGRVAEEWNERSATQQPRPRKSRATRATIHAATPDSDRLNLQRCFNDSQRVEQRMRSPRSSNLREGDAFAVECGRMEAECDSGDERGATTVRLKWCGASE